MSETDSTTTSQSRTNGKDNSTTAMTNSKIDIFNISCMLVGIFIAVSSFAQPQFLSTSLPSITIPGIEVTLTSSEWKPILLRLLHCLFIAQLIRSSHKDSVTFSQERPLASFLGYFLINDGSGTLVATMLGLPHPYLVDNCSILCSLFGWWAVFFSPFDLCFRIQSFLPCYLILSGIEETARAWRLYRAAELSLQMFPHSTVAAIACGTVAGGGSSLMTAIELSWRHSSLQLQYFRPSFTVKNSLVGSVFIVAAMQNWISLDAITITPLSGLVGTIVNIVSIALLKVDPYETVEYIVWTIFYRLPLSTHPIPTKKLKTN